MVVFFTFILLLLVYIGMGVRTSIGLGIGLGIGMRIEMVIRTGIGMEIGKGIVMGIRTDENRDGNRLSQGDGYKDEEKHGNRAKQRLPSQLAKRYKNRITKFKRFCKEKLNFFFFKYPYPGVNQKCIIGAVLLELLGLICIIDQIPLYTCTMHSPMK